MERVWSDAELISLFARVDNSGRWGPADELGTLNFITPDKRRSAAALVQLGRTVSLARPLVRGPQLDHRPHYFNSPDDASRVPPNAEDYLGFEVHQQDLTHVDCVSHIGGYAGQAYNGRTFRDVTRPDGLSHGSVYAQRDGIVSRGVLLDVAGALGVDWLEPAHPISPADVELAEQFGQVRVGTGDVVVLRAGVDARRAALGPEPLSPGPDPDLIGWLHEREVAVYAGDAPERLTPAGAAVLGIAPPGAGHQAERTRFPLALHQIAIPAMGLVLLDHCRVEELSAVCHGWQRYEFLFVAAPLALPGGTGSPVNPLAIF